MYEVQGNIWSYLALTGSIYLSSMTVLLIACCYWKKANNWGALCSIVLGALVPVLHLTCEKVPSLMYLVTHITKDHAGIAAFAASAIGMLVGSLLKPSSRTV
jgi:SSS family solute:Na+ symporter